MTLLWSHGIARIGHHAQMHLFPCLENYSKTEKAVKRFIYKEILRNKMNLLKARGSIQWLAESLLGGGCGNRNLPKATKFPRITDK